MSKIPNSYFFFWLMQGAYTEKQCDTEKKNDHFNLRIFLKNLIDKIHEMILYIMQTGILDWFW